MKISSNLLGLARVVSCAAALLGGMFISPTVFAVEYVAPRVLYTGQGHIYNTGQSFEAPMDAVGYAIKERCAGDTSRYNCSMESDPVWHFSSSNYQWWLSVDYSFQSRGLDATTTLHETLNVAISYDCPTNSSMTNHSTNPICALNNTDSIICDTCMGEDAQRASPTAGNPIIISRGVKFQVEVDYSNASGSLQFVRTFRSDQGNWSNNHEYSAMDFTRASASPPVNSCFPGKTVYGPYCFPYLGRSLPNDIAIRRGNNRTIYFGTTTDLSPAADVDDRVSFIYNQEGVKTGMSVANAKNGSTEIYDTTGRLISSTERNGRATVYSYSDKETPIEIAPAPGLLIGIADAFGQTLGFTYNAQSKISTLILPDGNLVGYEYNANSNISAVTYPDGKIRRYVYNEPENTAGLNEARFLTGIIDENDVRFATFKYNGNGVGLSTEHAGGVGKYQFSYSSGTTVVDPLGTTRTYHFSNLLGSYRNYYMLQPLANGSGSVSARTSYDANANISSIIDYNGIETTYAYDLSRNLKTKIVEASGTTLARTTSTEWHSTYRLPLRIAEPKKITTYTYDASGNMLTKSVQATTDANGASAFSAVAVGTPRAWTYTYSPLGQPLTSTGPANDTTTYTYDSRGNLSSVTNAAGHLTGMSNYDANGKVGRITDPNGLVTDFSYTPRGWLASKTVGGEAWQFDYDGVGQLTLLTAPDNSTVTYTYDGAHRLTAIADSAGNSIAYTLDPMGNRIAEALKDPGGNLARQTIRAYDALNRLKQQTAGAQ